MHNRKLSVITLAMLAISLIAGCGGSGNSETKAVSEVTEMVQSALQRMDEQVEDAASSISSPNLSSIQIRQILFNLCANESAAIECATVSTSGILTTIEPPQYSQFEGADISDQDHWILLSQTHQPVLSNLFKTVEGPYAVDLGWPLFDSADIWNGSVSFLIDPAAFINTAIASASPEVQQQVMVMQTDGTIIFDSDSSHIGLNTFTDPEFLSSASLQELARHVVSEPDGEGTYQFTADGSTEVVTKQAYWQTATLHGTQWRVMIIQE